MDNNLGIEVRIEDNFFTAFRHTPNQENYEPTGSYIELRLPFQKEDLLTSLVRTFWKLTPEENGQFVKMALEINSEYIK